MRTQLRALVLEVLTGFLRYKTVFEHYDWKWEPVRTFDRISRFLVGITYDGTCEMYKLPLRYNVGLRKCDKEAYSK